LKEFSMAASTSVNVAFLGIGLMGSRQAKRLLDAGYPLTVWNRSREKAEALTVFGARVVDTASEAVSSADIVILMLENGRIATDVLFSQGVAEALRPGTVLVDMSSIKPAEAQKHASHLKERGVHHIDAPVSGGTLGAEQGTLAIMAGGEADVFARVEPILEVMGRPVHVGPHGAGQLAKLANQIIVGVTIGAVAEALMLAQRGGADPAKVREALRGGFAESRILEVHGQRMVERDFIMKGRSVTHLKDLDNALDAAERIDLHILPYTALTADLLRGLIENAGDLDHSGLLVELERRNAQTS
jgi:3-hydroxyisobutyrate dehydrogenase-like beta-hydroxyacid dehydrogenase